MHPGKNPSTVQVAASRPPYICLALGRNQAPRHKAAAAIPVPTLGGGRPRFCFCSYVCMRGTEHSDRERNAMVKCDRVPVERKTTERRPIEKRRIEERRIEKSPTERNPIYLSSLPYKLPDFAASSAEECGCRPIPYELRCPFQPRATQRMATQRCFSPHSATAAAGTPMGMP